MVQSTTPASQLNEMEEDALGEEYLVTDALLCTGRMPTKPNILTEW